MVTDRSWAPRLLLILWIAFLAGCAVRLIQPYDDVIERTVTDFHEDFIRFTLVTGRARGTYADNRGFYDKWQPRLKTLTARALVANPNGKCPGTETYGGLLPQGVSAARAAATSPTARAGAPGGPAAPAGDCIAQLLQLLEDQLDDFAKFHEAQGTLGLPPDARAPRELVLTSARAVLYVELARKQGQ